MTIIEENKFLAKNAFNLYHSDCIILDFVSL